MSKQTQKATALNKRQGGSYTKCPKTGKLTLVNQTKLVNEALVANTGTDKKDAK